MRVLLVVQWTILSPIATWQGAALFLQPQAWQIPAYAGKIIPMQPRIETLQQTLLVGLKSRMSMANDTTADLFRTFMPRRREIQKPANKNLYLVKEYPPGFFDEIQPDLEFDKWVAVPIMDAAAMPGKRNMVSLIIPGGMERMVIHGLYAVFRHTGPASNGQALFHYIFTEWLPQSGVTLDERPHFDLMDDRYKHEDPASEEEFWIPVKHGH